MDCFVCIECHHLASAPPNDHLFFFPRCGNHLRRQDAHLYQSEIDKLDRDENCPICLTPIREINIEKIFKLQCCSKFTCKGCIVKSFELGLEKCYYCQRFWNMEDFLFKIDDDFEVRMPEEHLLYLNKIKTIQNIEDNDMLPLLTMQLLMLQKPLELRIVFPTFSKLGEKKIFYYETTDQHCPDCGKVFSDSDDDSSSE